MGKYKIGIYTICLNESKFAARWYNSCKEADYILVADTGSTDGSQEILRNLGVNVFDINVAPWRFDVARNASMALLPSDLDFIFSLDMDEVFAPGWREAMEKDITPETTRLRYPYVWSWTPDGKPDKSYGGDKGCSRKNYLWKGACHEVLKCTVPEVQTWCHDLHVYHFPDHTKSRSQYFPLLELAVSEDLSDDRNAFYLGREYYYYGMYDKAIAELKRHLSLPKATWYAERAMSNSFVSKSYMMLGNKQDAISWALKAVAEDPNSRECFMSLADLFYQYEDWHGVVYACETALKILYRDAASYLTERSAWEERPHILLTVGYWNLGNKKLAKHHAKEAFKYAPNNQLVIDNLAWFK